MKLIKANGINFCRGMEFKELSLRTEDALRHKTLSISDDDTGEMLEIVVTKDIEKVLKELCK